MKPAETTRRTLFDPQGVPCGGRVSVVSMSGSTYELTFLAEYAEAWIVRLPDRRLARLFVEQVDWSTLRRLEGAPEAPILPSDEVQAVLPSGLVRGRVERLSCDGLHLRLGRTAQVVSRHELLGVNLLFPANELLADDCFLVRSWNGILYEGWVCGTPTNDQLPVEFSGGSRCSLRWSRLDPDTLRLKVPIPDQASVSCRSHELWRPLCYQSTRVE